jgi:hypothetical protein
MNNENPRFSNIRLDLRLTNDDNGKPLLFVESGGYFHVPPHIMGQLEALQSDLSSHTQSDIATRFVLHAMLSNQLPNEL